MHSVTPHIFLCLSVLGAPLPPAAAPFPATASLGPTRQKARAANQHHLHFIETDLLALLTSAATPLSSFGHSRPVFLTLNPPPCSVCNYACSPRVTVKTGDRVRACRAAARGAFVGRATVARREGRKQASRGGSERGAEARGGCCTNQMQLGRAAARGGHSREHGAASGRVQRNNKTASAQGSRPASRSRRRRPAVSCRAHKDS